MNTKKFVDEICLIDDFENTLQKEKIRAGYFQIKFDMSIDKYIIIQGFIPKKYNFLFTYYRNNGCNIEKLHDIPLETRNDFLECYEKAGKYGLIDENGNVILDVIYDYLGILDREKNRYVFTKKDSKWSIYDIEMKKWIYKNEFDNVSIFHYTYDNETDDVIYNENLKMIAVCKDDKWGYLDENCLLVVPPMYEEAKSTQNRNSMMIKENDKYSIINTKNEFISKDLPYKEMYSLTNDCYEVIDELGRSGIINMNDEIVIPLDKNYDYVSSTFIDGLFFASNKDIRYFYDKSGKMVFSKKFDMYFVLGDNDFYYLNNNKIYDINDNIKYENVKEVMGFGVISQNVYSKDYFTIKDMNDKNIILDKEFKKIFEGQLFEFYYPKQKKFIVVDKENDSYVLKELDYDGNVIRIYPTNFSSIKLLNNNMAIAIIDGDWTIIDRNNYKQ